MMTRSSRSNCGHPSSSAAPAAAPARTRARRRRRARAATMAASRAQVERRDSARKRVATPARAGAGAAGRDTWIVQHGQRGPAASATTTRTPAGGTARAQPTRRGGLAPGVRRPQQLHHLLRRRLRLLAQLRREPRRQLEVVLRVPVVGRGFDRLAELLFRAAQPAEPRVGLLLDDRLLEERARRPRNSATRRPAPSARGRSPRRSASSR